LKWCCELFNVVEIEFYVINSAVVVMSLTHCCCCLLSHYHTWLLVWSFRVEFSQVQWKHFLPTHFLLKPRLWAKSVGETETPLLTASTGFWIYRPDASYPVREIAQLEQRKCAFHTTDDWMTSHLNSQGAYFLLLWHFAYFVNVIVFNMQLREFCITPVSRADLQQCCAVKSCKVLLGWPVTTRLEILENLKMSRKARQCWEKCKCQSSSHQWQRLCHRVDLEVTSTPLLVDGVPEINALVIHSDSTVKVVCQSAPENTILRQIFKHFQGVCMHGSKWGREKPPSTLSTRTGRGPSCLLRLTVLFIVLPGSIRILWRLSWDIIRCKVTFGNVNKELFSCCSDRSFVMHG